MTMIALSPRQPAYDTRVAAGAAAELRASATLLDAGYQVWRAESPHAPFDLVVKRPDGPLLAVEVKAASWRRNLHAPNFAWPRHDSWDLLAIVVQAGWGKPEQVLLFTADTPKPQVRAALREAYGFSPVKATFTAARD